MRYYIPIDIEVLPVFTEDNGWYRVTGVLIILRITDFAAFYPRPNTTGPTWD